MITINHSGDGTTVEGTERSDAPTLKAAGFRWSRNLGAWYLPRTWSEPVRAQRVRQLAAALGERCTVERGDVARTGTADEWAAARVERGLARAERLDARADKREDEREALYKRSTDLVAGIPFGQPILVGHHSERRHRNAVNKSWDLMGKAVEAGREADHAAAGADTARHAAETYDDPVKVGRRLERNEAELRRLIRMRDGAPGRGDYGIGFHAPATGAHAETLRGLISDLTAVVERDRRVLAETGRGYSRENVRAGDLVRIRGNVYRVDKANPKTVQITTFGLRLTYPYAEITAHTPAADIPTP